MAGLALIFTRNAMIRAQQLLLLDLNSVRYLEATPIPRGIPVGLTKTTKIASYSPSHTNRNSRSSQICTTDQFFVLITMGRLLEEATIYVSSVTQTLLIVRVRT